VVSAMPPWPFLQALLRPEAGAKVGRHD